MKDFEKKLILSLSELIVENDGLKQSVEYWQQEVDRLNKLYEKITNDYATLSKSVRNG